MYPLLFRQFLRSRIVLAAMLVLLMMGFIAILIGKQFLQKEGETIKRVTEHQRLHIERNVKANDEMGLLMYYLKFALISKPDPLAGVSIGQRDINPGIQSVTIRTLEAQKYDTDLTNPVQLQSGNLDLGFVIIYLFPLAIIAFTFNLLSEDEESGTWKLVAVQSQSPLHFLVAKFTVRAFAIYGLFFTLIVVAVLFLPLPLNETLTAMVILTCLYIAFWFALSFWLSMFRRSSGFNVVTLLTVWVLLTILLPASVNNLVASALPVPEALSTMVKQRDGYHKKWDLEKKVTMDKFYEHYPQFKKYGVPEDNFWLWYYAMQQMGDDESGNESKAMREKLLQREAMSRSIAFAIPTMHAQIQMNDLAQTSLIDYLRLVDNAVTFHEKNRLYFYPMIFDNVSSKTVDWERFKPEFLPARKGVDWLSMIVPFLVITVVLMVWGLIRSTRLYRFG